MDKTKEKIIGAAMRLFAEKGLEGVTVREICRAAQVNGALVNYHFRNKEGLYRECVERVYAVTFGTKMSESVEGVRDTCTWKAAVRTWIETFAEVLQAKTGIDSSAAGIFRQEATHPSKMQPYLEEHFARPVRSRLFRLMRMATDDDREAHLWSDSIWIQLSAHAIYHPVWRTLHRPPDVSEDDWGRALVDHVCATVFGGLDYRGKSGLN